MKKVFKYLAGSIVLLALAFTVAFPLIVAGALSIGPL